ncbi:MAG: hypothetical protein J3K34DRAFT_473046 [Monoraphidium minutum]|nr:MAG: hypothetical protein J3K34DRAFT_473046 [Monoraphidium minutum]
MSTGRAPRGASRGARTRRESLCLVNRALGCGLRGLMHTVFLRGPEVAADSPRRPSYYYESDDDYPYRPGYDSPPYGYDSPPRRVASPGTGACARGGAGGRAGAGQARGGRVAWERFPGLRRVVVRGYGLTAPDLAARFSIAACGEHAADALRVLARIEELDLSGIRQLPATVLALMSALMPRLARVRMPEGAAPSRPYGSRRGADPWPADPADGLILLSCGDLKGAAAAAALAHATRLTALRVAHLHGKPGVRDKPAFQLAAALPRLRRLSGPWASLLATPLQHLTDLAVFGFDFSPPHGGSAAAPFILPQLRRLRVFGAPRWDGRRARQAGPRLSPLDLARLAVAAPGLRCLEVASTNHAPARRRRYSSDSGGGDYSDPDSPSASDSYSSDVTSSDSDSDADADAGAHAGGGAVGDADGGGRVADAGGNTNSSGGNDGATNGAGPAAVAGAAWFPHLTSLILRGAPAIALPGPGAPAGGFESVDAPQAFPALRQLAVLDCETWRLPFGEGLARLTGLSALCALHEAAEHMDYDEDLRDSYDCDDHWNAPLLGEYVLSVLAACPAPARLHCHVTAADAPALARLTALESVSLEVCGLLDQTDPDFAYRNERNAKTITAAVAAPLKAVYRALGALPRLRALRLRLPSAICGPPAIGPAAGAPGALAPLLGAAALRELELSGPVLGSAGALLLVQGLSRLSALTAAVDGAALTRLGPVLRAMRPGAALSLRVAGSRGVHLDWGTDDIVGAGRQGW